MPTMAIRHRPDGGLGAGVNSENMAAQNLVNNSADTYRSLSSVMGSLDTAMDEFAASKAAFNSELTKAAMQGMAGVGPMFAGVFATMAVVQTVNAVKKEGIDPLKESKDTFMAIVDSVKHTDAATRAWRNLKLKDFVSYGLIDEKGALQLLGLIGLGNSYGTDQYVTRVMEAWASTVKADTTAYTRYALEYGSKMNSVLAKVRSVGTSMQLVEGTDYKLYDPALESSIKSGMLNEMSKVHAEVKAGRPPQGWFAATVNWLLDHAIYLVFGLAGVAFSTIFGTASALGEGMSKEVFAAAKLLVAAQKIAGAAVVKYATTFTEVRVTEKKPEAEAAAAATTAMKETIEVTGKQEWNKAYSDIEAYRNYARQMQEFMSNFGSGFFDALKGLIPYVIIGGVVLIGGIAVVNRITK